MFRPVWDKSPSRDRPNYAYAEVVRSKQERKKMQGTHCELSEGYYERMNGVLNPDGNPNSTP